MKPTPGDSLKCGLAGTETLTKQNTYKTNRFVNLAFTLIDSFRKGLIGWKSPSFDKFKRQRGGWLYELVV